MPLLASHTQSSRVSLELLRREDHNYNYLRYFVFSHHWCLGKEELKPFTKGIHLLSDKTIFKQNSIACLMRWDQNFRRNGNSKQKQGNVCGTSFSFIRDYPALSGQN